MSGGKRKRRQYDPQLRLRALAIARARGAAAAERETGVRAATIRSWLSRGVDADPTTEVEVATGEALEQEQAGALTDVELEALHRRIGQQIDAALVAGDALAAQRLGVLLGITEDKLRARRADESARASAGAFHSVERTEAAERRLAATLDMLRVRQARLLATATIEALREERARLGQTIAVAIQQRRVLLDEELRRRDGRPSLFDPSVSLPAPYVAGVVRLKPLVPEALAGPETHRRRMEPVSPAPIARRVVPPVEDVVEDQADDVADEEPAAEVTPIAAPRRKRPTRARARSVQELIGGRPTPGGVA